MYFWTKKEIPEDKKGKLIDRLFKFIAEKLMFEHHDYLEEYVDMLNDQG